MLLHADAFSKSAAKTQDRVGNFKLTCRSRRERERERESRQAILVDTARKRSSVQMFYHTDDNNWLM